MPTLNALAKLTKSNGEYQDLEGPLPEMKSITKVYSYLAF
jgi:hypothetical protein